MSKDAEQTPVIAERPKPLPWWLFPLWRLAAPVIATATLVPAVAVVLLVVVWLDLPMLAMVPAVTIRAQMSRCLPVLSASTVK